MITGSKSAFIICELSLVQPTVIDSMAKGSKRDSQEPGPEDLANFTHS